MTGSNDNEKLIIIFLVIILIGSPEMEQYMCTLKQKAKARATESF